VEGFKHITESALEEFFLVKMGLQQIEYSQASGLAQLRSEFLETQNEYKWEFFASSKRHYGQFTAFLDVEK